MLCSKSDTCANHDICCDRCMLSNYMWQCYVPKKVVQTEFMIFFGNAATTRADDKLNAWLKRHPNVRILSYQYQQARMGDHSICVMYEEY